MTQRIQDLTVSIMLIYKSFPGMIDTVHNNEVCVCADRAADMSLLLTIYFHYKPLFIR